MAATRTLARLYEDRAAATAAVSDLEAAGFARDDIGVVASDGGGGGATDQAEGLTGSTTGAATGASVGTVLGGGAGLLASLGLLAIPGFGPVLAAGGLVATLTGAGVGAAAGGLAGALGQAGLGEEDARYYAEGVGRGGTLVTVRAEQGREAEADGILRRHAPAEASPAPSDGEARRPRRGVGTARDAGPDGSTII